MDVKWVELSIFIFLFALVSRHGLLSPRAGARPRRMEHLDEWGLGGRKFGSWITWFLLGGDLYTAYTFVAVPGLVFAVGALGFFAVPYTILIFPLAFVVAPRLWSVAHKHGYVTPADFVRGRHGSPTLALLIAITGIVATMPYIALQLVGIGAVLRTMGVEGEWPLIIAFVILAAYTYQSGLRAPALIAFVKDTLIYIVVIVAVIYIPIKLGGFDEIFGAAQKKFDGTEPPVVDGLMLADAQILGYSTLAFGSALALFLYPHSITGLLASRSRDTIRRNMAALPAYSFMLGLLALLGLMAIAAGVKPLDRERQAGRQHGRAAAVRQHVPGLVRRHRLRRHRHRRARARRDHVDRRGEPVHAQHLPRVPAPERDARRGGAGQPSSRRWSSRSARSWSSSRSTRSSRSTCS